MSYLSWGKLDPKYNLIGMIDYIGRYLKVSFKISTTIY